jgi:hypothetical protein
MDDLPEDISDYDDDVDFPQDMTSIVSKQDDWVTHRIDKADTGEDDR